MGILDAFENDYQKTDTAKTLEPIPKGTYYVKIDGVSWDISKNGFPQFLYIFIIMAGKYIGRKKLYWHTINNATDKKDQNISISIFKGTAELLGIKERENFTDYEETEVLEEFLDKICKIKIGEKTDKITGQKNEQIFINGTGLDAGAIAEMERNFEENKTSETNSEEKAGIDTDDIPF